MFSIPSSSRWNASTGPTALLPGWLPLPVMARFRQAVARLDHVVYDVIARRRQHKSERNDLLSILLHAQDDDGKSHD